MDTKQALAELGVTPALTSEQREALDRDGFFIVENVLTPQQCVAMREEFDRVVEAESGSGVVMDAEAGATRLSDLFNKSDVFDAALAIEPVLAASYYLLGDFKLHGANIRDPHQGGGDQPLHSDVPKSAEEDWRLVNALIVLDDLTLDNGPTRIVPGSHRLPHNNTPTVNLAEGEEQRGEYGDQTRFPEDPYAEYPGQILFTAPAGSVAVCNASLWHGGTSNKDGARRRMLHLTYTRRDLMQQFVQQDHLTEGLYERLSPAQRHLFDVQAPASA
ncbi:phytanoyl-CoA dioxygenase family protein [Streptosporangium sp. DT93]|uniref:phytanoyl-CoA dioxygenase family protein n=1 Tax=Streptosporangium sp. DT93 TaxID=3393428 RepID=UPI003CED792B